MLDKILNLKEDKNSVSEFVDGIRQGIPLAVFGVPDAFKCFLSSVISYPVLYIAKDFLSASFVMSEIKELSNKKVVYIPPKDETLISTRAFSKDSLFNRLCALSTAKDADVIVLTIDAMLQTFPKNIETLKISKNDSIDQQSIEKRLVLLGYTRVESVESKGTFSVRGDVLDIFPINGEEPIRADFFGDNVESLKKFDIETRKSLGYIDSVEVIQATEFIIDDATYNLAEGIMKNEIANAGREQAVRLKCIFDDFEVAFDNKDNDALSPISVFSDNCGSIFDYLSKDTVVMIDEGKRIYDSAQLFEREFTERYNSLLSSGEVFKFASRNLLPLASVIERLKDYRECALQSISSAIPFFNPLKIISPLSGGVVNYQLDFKELFTDIKNWKISGYSVYLCTGDVKRAENLAIDLTDNGIICTLNTDNIKNNVIVSSESLTSGFIFHEEKQVVIGSGNLYNKPLSARKLKVKKQGFFTAPEAGDYCVHEIHGIGKVLGNKRISSTEGTKDYVAIEYSGGDILYVPVEQMDILSRYLGGDKKPKLSKIGGVDFEKIKKSVRESIRKMSFDLKKLYAERKEEKGFKFVIDEELENAFIADFPFEDTLDQTTANQEIKSDMESGIIMDRLVCGDVGFGKTEVAFRAVFRAIVNGKQVAMLAPTTILTEQHYNTALERFKNFGVKIAVLNRFKTARQQAQILEKIKNGEIDFVIGTHRLLSKDVAFKDLGLLVLDEEQRFGVEHKEKIKLLKNNVDTLTLTATPIPRTLHMSLSGIRSISVINTPPKKRLPVQTYVTEESEILIKDAISREINRNGQAFILYNRVESIFTFASRISAIMPNLKITVVHGQMDEKVMEKSILDFYQGKSDVLISTTIIENGIDLPRANTLIVIDADNLGLSTLYQLKGRVGRSDRLAYAYFTFKREKVLSTTAFDRLNAIIEFTEMGSGIKIAMRDLEIRGAGNVLGAEQHGHMDKIGYELYSKILREEISGKEEKIPDLDIRISAFIPETYIESNTMRMDAYKEIAEISSLSEEKEFIESMTETYGKLPLEVLNLVKIAVVKFLAQKISASSIAIKKEETFLEFEDYKAFADEKLSHAIDEFSGDVSISMTTSPKIVFYNDGKKNNEQMLSLMRDFLISATKKEK